MEGVAVADLRVALRTAEPGDAPSIAAVRDAGVATYADWAGRDWRPPLVDRDELALIRRRLAEPETCCVVAESGAEMLGFVAFKPLHTQWGRGDPVPGAARLWMLFVRPDAWGRGLGRRLLATTMDEMRTRGYRRARVRTPAGARRARRTYEGAGWRQVEADTGDFGGLELVAYGVDLAPSGA